MKTNLLVILLSAYCLVLGCKAKKTQIDTKIDSYSVAYAKKMNSNSEYEYVPKLRKKEVLIFFQDGFSDTISIIVEGKEKFSGFLKTHRGMGTTAFVFSAKYKQSVQIISKSTGHFISFVIAEDFNVLYVDKFENKWYLKYSKHITMSG